MDQEMAQLNLKGDAKLTRWNTGQGGGSTFQIRPKKGALSAPQSRGRPVLLVGECRVGLWELWADGRQRLRAQDHEVKTVRIGDHVCEHGTGRVSLWQWGAGTIGTAAKGKETIKDDCSRPGNRWQGSEDGEKETVLNYFRCVGMTWM